MLDKCYSNWWDDPPVRIGSSQFLANEKGHCIQMSDLVLGYTKDDCLKGKLWVNNDRVLTTISLYAGALAPGHSPLGIKYSVEPRLSSRCDTWVVHPMLRRLV